MFYAQISNGVVVGVSEVHSQIDAPDMIALEAFDVSLLGQSYSDGLFTPISPVASTRITKRAFHNRFPKSADGISTKYDAVSLFLIDDGYAASLGVTGAAMYGLRMLIVAGKNRLDASQFVDLGATEAADFTLLLTQGAIPADLRLTAEQRTAMLTTPIADGERYAG